MIKWLTRSLFKDVDDVIKKSFRDVSKTAIRATVHTSLDLIVDKLCTKFIDAINEDLKDEVDFKYKFIKGEDGRHFISRIKKIK